MVAVDATEAVSNRRDIEEVDGSSWVSWTRVGMRTARPGVVPTYRQGTSEQLSTRSGWSLPPIASM
jgi:hypothetical protein